MNADVLGPAVKHKLERTIYDILKNSIDDNFIKAGTLGSRVTHALSDGIVYNKPVIQGVLRTMDPKQWTGFVFDSQLGAKVLRVPSRQLGSSGPGNCVVGEKMDGSGFVQLKVRQPSSELRPFSFFSHALPESNDLVISDVFRPSEASVPNSNVLKPPPPACSPIEQKRFPTECFDNMGSRLFLSNGTILKLSVESCDHDEIIFTDGKGSAACADCGIRFSSISLSDFLRNQKRN